MVTSSKFKSEYDLTGFFEIPSWRRAMKELIESKYYEKLNKFLHLNYKLNGNKMMPLPVELTTPFEFSEFEDVKVVILGDEPHNENINNGLAFASDYSISSMFEAPSTTKVLNNIEKTIHDGCMINGDPTFTDWATQDILILNTVLTKIKNEDFGHEKVWRNFIRYVIHTFNLKRKDPVIFLLWGEKALSFKKYIDTDKHMILSCESPTKAVIENREWECDHFPRVNEILKGLGKETITW